MSFDPQQASLDPTAMYNHFTVQPDLDAAPGDHGVALYRTMMAEMFPAHNDASTQYGPTANIANHVYPPAPATARGQYPPQLQNPAVLPPTPGAPSNSMSWMDAALWIPNAATMAPNPNWLQQQHVVAPLSASAPYAAPDHGWTATNTRPIVPVDVTPGAPQRTSVSGSAPAMVPRSSAPRDGQRYGVPVQPADARSRSTSAAPSPGSATASLFPAIAGPRQTPAPTSASQHPAPSMARFVKIAPRSAQPTPSSSQPSCLPPEKIAERIASMVPRGRRGPRRNQAPVTAGHAGPAVLQPFVSPRVESSSRASLAVAGEEPATLAALPTDAPPSLVMDLPTGRKRGHSDAIDDSPAAKRIATEYGRQSRSTLDSLELSLPVGHHVQSSNNFTPPHAQQYTPAPLETTSTSLTAATEDGEYGDLFRDDPDDEAAPIAARLVLSGPAHRAANEQNTEVSVPVPAPAQLLLIHPAGGGVRGTTI
ncbi:hypothetical protein AURDEDRAFT_188443 [Auricularia subglabra TFB-10046 SS5]|uniref:Uncharacterized protein n=1 Tax=Auricularia subglabra (strain TFB-10046 / SS5) TaxID=717982 RepID=J0D954_AURST|nr:hypothetical protein AURDEDRAFT_188443 [Auricularia subglabra TFB-10046 SS5]